MAGRRRFLAELLRRLAPFLAVFLTVYVVAAVGFFLLEHGTYSLLDSFYWGIVSLSTVGYGDVVPSSDWARVFTSGVLFTQIFLGGYLFSVIVGIVNEESQRRLLGTLGTDFYDHTLVLGHGAIGRAAVRELLLQDQQVAVVTSTSEEVANVRSLAPPGRLFVTYGPAAEEEILRRAGVEKAHSIVICLEDDTLTLIAALNVRNLAPAARIVVSVSRPELKRTLRAAGVTYVASPGDLGGRLCAAAAFEPDVAAAFEDLTEAGEGADLREYLLTERTPVARQGLREAEAIVREHTGCLVVGVSRRAGDAEYSTVLNPPDDWQFRPGDGILILGSNANQRRFREWIGVPQGR